MSITSGEDNGKLREVGPLLSTANKREISTVNVNDAKTKGAVW